MNFLFKYMNQHLVQMPSLISDKQSNTKRLLQTRYTTQSVWMTQMRSQPKILGGAK